MKQLDFRKITSAALVFIFSLQLCGLAAAAEPAPFIWRTMETNESDAGSKETNTDSSKNLQSPLLMMDKKGNTNQVIPLSTSQGKNDKADKQTDASGKTEQKPSVSMTDPDELTRYLNDLARKRQEEDRYLIEMLQKQKVQAEQQRALAEQKEREQREQAEKAQRETAALKEEQDKKLEEMKNQAAIQAKELETLKNTISAIQPQKAEPISPAPPVAEISIEPVKIRPIQDQINDYTQDGKEVVAREADILFNYSFGQLYRVYTREGFVTDIQLEPGEEIQYVGGGDTVRWVIDKAFSGSGAMKTWHLYIKPTKPDIRTNLVVTTDRRSYQIVLESTTWYNPIITWRYSNTSPNNMSSGRMNDVNNIGSRSNREYVSEVRNYNYAVTGNNYDWKPKAVYDNGAKTIIEMPAGMETSAAPVLYVRDGNGKLALVNHRLVGRKFIIDRLFNKAELRNGKEIIKIERDSDLLGAA